MRTAVRVKVPLRTSQHSKIIEEGGEALDFVGGIASFEAGVADLGPDVMSEIVCAHGLPRMGVVADLLQLGLEFRLVSGMLLGIVFVQIKRGRRRTGSGFDAASQARRFCRRLLMLFMLKVATFIDWIPHLNGNACCRLSKPVTAARPMAAR
jgi:hypothetical protein